MSQNSKKLLLVFGDSAVFYLSLFSGLSLRRLEFIDGSVWNEHVIAFTAVLIIWIVVFYINDLYTVTQSRSGIKRINNIAASMGINILIAALFFYLTAAFWNIRPQTVLAILAIIFTLLLFLWRTLIDTFFGSTAFRNNVLVIGLHPISQELISYLSTQRQLGYSVRAVVDASADARSTLPLYLVENNNLKDVLKKHAIHTVVVSLDMYDNPTLTAALYSTLRPDIRIVNLPRFYEEVTGKIPVNQIGRTWVLENFTGDSKRLYDTSKRILDIISSLVLGTFTILLLPFITLAIYLDTGKPIFFKQVRVGHLGKEFLAIKFRTMQRDAEKNGAQWAEKRDPRITRTGKFLRKTRLDELPQLWNVFKGDMSLIGSRPERPTFVNELVAEIPFYKERLLVKPGITGWAQVMGPAYGGSKDESLEKLQYDLYYLKNRSLGLDIAIALKTIKTILSIKGQ